MGTNADADDFPCPAVTVQTGRCRFDDAETGGSEDGVAQCREKACACS